MKLSQDDDNEVLLSFHALFESLEKKYPQASKISIFDVLCKALEQVADERDAWIGEKWEEET